MTTFQKSREGKLDYCSNWTDWLDGDTIGTSTWRVPSDMTTVKTGIESPATHTTIWLTGGTIGNFVKITNTITTATSPERIASRSFYVEVVQR
jgi:hypothetical protein